MNKEKEKLMPELFLFICEALCDDKCTEGVGGCVCDSTYALDCDENATLDGVLKTTYKWYKNHERSVPLCICRWKNEKRLLSFIKCNFDELKRLYDKRHDTKWILNEDFKKIVEEHYLQETKTFILEKLKE